MKRQITNWNNYPVVEAEEVQVRQEKDIRLKGYDHVIARGLGRCYGDASLAANVLDMTHMNKYLSFDPQSGLLECEAGVSLRDILETFVPHGWFLPVTPGTKYITVGGAVASDVHGKNHHVEGSFSNHVLEIRLMTPRGEIITVSEKEYPRIFQATLGGMGLTGIILTVKFRLKPIETSFIRQKQVKSKNLDDIIDLFEQYKDYTYSMAWIDCLKQGRGFGRSILIVGEHATVDEIPKKYQSDPLQLPKNKKINMPVYLPGFVLNSLSIRAFNLLYYNKNYKREMNSVVPYDGFFYPLDSILHWNRMYGKRGFIQYQFVLPLESSREGLVQILKMISKKGMGSFLAVLKLFGHQDSLISFPMEGYTLALDFPIKKGLFEFLDELDRVVSDFGGRIYLSKDARMEAGFFKDSYPNAEEFLEIINEINPGSKIESILSKRLTITP